MKVSVRRAKGVCFNAKFFTMSLDSGGWHKGPENTANFTAIYTSLVQGALRHQVLTPTTESSTPPHSRLQLPPTPEKHCQLVRLEKVRGAPDMPQYAPAACNSCVTPPPAPPQPLHLHPKASQHT